MKYKDQVLGCWLGKSVGGTLGMPYEGQDGPHALTFYNPVPESMLPNDDLDLQVVWACVLNQMQQPRVGRDVLAKAWLNHVQFPMDEYGIALRNLRIGIQPPYSGSYDNWFIHGMGAAIRSELWACLAPGQPELAAAYAYEDACVDHAGEGVWAEVFLAALESMAFTETNVVLLVETAISQLPQDSSVRMAVKDTLHWFDQNDGWLLVRELILQKYGHVNFTDVTMNMAFIVLALLNSHGNFSRGICTAANCGKDTDCTAATTGAILGIMNPDSIDEKWLKPIGKDLLLSPEIVGIKYPGNLENFADMIVCLRQRISDFPGEANKYEPNFEAGAITVDVTFVNRMPDMNQDISSMMTKSEKYVLAGLNATYPASDFGDDVILVKYSFELNTPQNILLMVNTHSACHVWLDNVYCFGRSGGEMSPSLHRTPWHPALINQYKAIFLDSGSHDFVAAMLKPEESEDLNWFAGIGDSATFHWDEKILHSDKSKQFNMV